MSNANIREFPKQGPKYGPQIIRLVLQGHPEKIPAIFGKGNINLPILPRIHLCSCGRFRGTTVLGSKYGPKQALSENAGAPKAADPRGFLSCQNRQNHRPAHTYVFTHCSYMRYVQLCIPSYASACAHRNVQRPVDDGKPLRFLSQLALDLV